MACYWSGSSPGAAEADEFASASMLDAAAGAVAARGVLFANVHQARHRRQLSLLQLVPFPLQELSRAACICHAHSTSRRCVNVMFLLCSPMV